MATVPPLPQPKEVKLTNGENAQRQHAYSVAVATAEAAVAAAQAAAEVVRLTTVTQFGGKLREEVAVIRIQTAFRGYMVHTTFFLYIFIFILHSVIDATFF